MTNRVKPRDTRWVAAGLRFIPHRPQKRQDYERNGHTLHMSSQLCGEKKQRKKNQTVSRKFNNAASGVWGMISLAILECLPSLVSLLVEYQFTSILRRTMEGLTTLNSLRRLHPQSRALSTLGRTNTWYIESFETRFFLRSGLKMI